MPLGVDTLIDWSGAGTYTGTGEDVSARVTSAGMTIQYGLDSARSGSFAAPGAASFELTNTSGDYSPENTSSPLFPNVLRARNVLVRGTVGGVSSTLYSGRLDDYTLEYSYTPTASIGCTDGLAELAGVTVSTGLYSGLRSGDAVNILLDAAGWDGGRDIDPGASIFPWFWLDGTDALAALQEIVASEGCPSFAMADENGNLMFRDRHYRIVRSASRTVAATLAESGIDSSSSARWSYPFTYDHGRNAIVNSVEWEINQRKIDGQVSAVWNAEDIVTVRLADGESQDIVAKANDPFVNVVPPVLDTDYRLTYGTVTVSVDVISGQTATMTFTATGGPALVTNIQLRAYAVPATQSVKVARRDGASQAKYGRIAADSSLEPKWCTYRDAADIASLLIGARAERLPVTQVTLRGGNDFILGQQLGRNIGDLVQVTNTPAGVNWPGYLNRIEHAITGAGDDRILTTVFSVEKAQSASTTNTFILDTSALNGTDVLAASGYNDPASVFILNQTNLGSGVLAY